MTIADAVLYARNEFGFEAFSIFCLLYLAQVSPKVLERRD